MKKIVIIFCVFFGITKSNAQFDIDAYVGENGVFKTLIAKNIPLKNAISFDVKLTVKSTAIGGSNKVQNIILYLDTKNGFVGVDKSEDVSKFPSEKTKGLYFLIESMTKESYVFSNTGGSRNIEKLETNLINTFNKEPFKQTAETVAKPKKYLNNSITALPYFRDKMGMQREIVRYCYGNNYPKSSFLKSYLGSFGVGFYNIDGQTFLCVATEHKFTKMEITKIEKVNFQFDTSLFKLKN